MKTLQWIFLSTNLVLISRYITVSTQTIVTGPRDASGVLDSSLRLECIVTEFSVSHSSVLLWQVPGGSVLINHHENIPSMYANKFSTETNLIDTSRNEYKFSLIIHNLENNDGGIYQCKVLFNSDIVSEESANIYVITASDNGNPSCFSNPSGHLLKNERVTLTCMSNSATADLVWRSNGRLLPSTSSTKYAASTNEFSFTVDENGQKYSCVSIALNSECNIVLSVKYSPEVEITLTEEEVEIGKDVGFSCDAVGNPDSFSYIWYYDGRLITENERINGFQLNDNGKVLTLPEISNEDDRVTLTCVASNDIGEGVGQFVVEPVEGNSIIEIVGPILICLVLFFILAILIAFFVWYYRQVNTIKTIKKKEMIRRAESARKKRENGHIPVRATSRLVGNTNGGYIKDIVPNNNDDDDDEDRLRPIPRRKSEIETLSIGKKGSVESSMSDYIVQDMPTEDDEDNMQTSYVYQVNPHFGDLNGKKGSYTVNRDDSESSLPSEVDSEEINSIVPSTDL